MQMLLKRGGNIPSPINSLKYWNLKWEFTKIPQISDIYLGISVGMYHLERTFFVPSIMLQNSSFPIHFECNRAKKTLSINFQNYHETTGDTFCKILL